MGAGARVGRAHAERDGWDQTEQQSDQCPGAASHELSASAIARSRNAWSISPREIATMWP